MEKNYLVYKGGERVYVESHTEAPVNSIPLTARQYEKLDGITGVNEETIQGFPATVTFLNWYLSRWRKN